MAKEHDKGKRFERKIRDLFRNYVDPQCKRQLQSGADEWNKGDLRFSKTIPHNLIIECKHHERLQFWPWYKQAKDQATQFETPILAFTKNHEDAIIAMKAEDFMKIYEELVGYIRQAEEEQIHSCEHAKESWRLKTAIKHIKEYIKS